MKMIYKMSLNIYLKNYNNKYIFKENMKKVAIREPKKKKIDKKKEIKNSNNAKLNLALFLVIFHMSRVNRYL